MDAIYMVETKKEMDMNTAEVQEKAKAAMEYCRHATDYNLKNGCVCQLKSDPFDRKKMIHF